LFRLIGTGFGVVSAVNHKENLAFKTPITPRENSGALLIVICAGLEIKKNTDGFPSVFFFISSRI